MPKVFPTLETECPVCSNKLIIRYDKEKNEYTTTTLVNSETGHQGEPAAPGEETGEVPEAGDNGGESEDDMDFGFKTS